MQRRLVKVTMALVCAGFLAGCDTSTGIGRLFSKSATDAGPDEFAILPTKPLELPKDYANLPEPNPGGGNRVDQHPDQDAVAALGGNPKALSSTNIQSSETALLAAATRNGTTPNIREVLAKEDAEFREKNGPRFFERIFGTDVYFKRYEDETLAGRSEQERMRQIGARTPTSPPVGLE